VSSREDTSDLQNKKPETREKMPQTPVFSEIVAEKNDVEGK